MLIALVCLPFAGINLQYVERVFTDTRFAQKNLICMTNEDANNNHSHLETNAQGRFSP